MCCVNQKLVVESIKQPSDISTTATKPESLAKPGVLDDQPICEVTVTCADEPDEAAIRNAPAS